MKGVQIQTEEDLSNHPPHGRITGRHAVGFSQPPTRDLLDAGEDIRVSVIKEEKGSPTNKRDLYARADALKADSVVILRFDGGSDAKSIMIFRMVKRGRCKPIIQLGECRLIIFY